MSNDKRIVIAEGGLIGKVTKTYEGTHYLSFQGIPYAEPPINELRFQPPQEKKPWCGDKNAKELGAASIGEEIFPGAPSSKTSEDCLYLNVYAPENISAPKPVLFWVHGGSFNLGSAGTNIYGPDYLVSKNVVVVTFNYRLGALGFLSLQNEKCPGNNGLKDQVMALKWVKRNIKAFGGDPDRVTIFGESAGAAAVQYLMLSPLTKGLFHGAISSSGSALSPWAYIPNPVDAAFALGRMLGCTKMDQTKDKDALLKFLKEVEDPNVFLIYNNVIMKLIQPNEPHMTYPFLPVVEPDVSGAFLSKTPQETIEKGLIHDVPYILGVNTEDGLAVLKCPHGAHELISDEQWETLIPSNFIIERNSAQSKIVVEKIKKVHFPDGWNQQDFYDLLHITYFALPNDTILKSVAKLKNRKSKLYFYQFSYRGELGYIVRNNFNFPDCIGTIHAEDLMYYWRSDLVPSEKKISDDDERTIKIFTEMWKNFAYHKNPNADDSTLWKPYQENSRVYLDIGTKLAMKEDLLKERIEFWRKLYNDHSKDNVHKIA